MLQAGRWSTTAPPKVKLERKAMLSDEETRRRIFANAAVLFPSSSAQGDQYEIVYGIKPQTANSSHDADWQYALLVRRNPDGKHTPLVKGPLCQTSKEWSTVLQGLLDTTATLIHRTVGQAPMPPLGILEHLPQYSPQQNQQS